MASVVLGKVPLPQVLIGHSPPCNPGHRSPQEAALANDCFSVADLPGT